MNKYFINHVKHNSNFQGHPLNDLQNNGYKQHHDFEKRLSQILETTYFA